jgi:putative ABC transport system permease protein
MVGYYLRLALVSFKSRWMMTMLMIVAIAVGVAITMTAYTVLNVMSSDPIPWKSNQLFAVQVDNGGSRSRKGGDDEPPTQLTYQDAMALMRIGSPKRRVAMYQIELTVTPPDRGGQKPFPVAGRAISGEFFRMFDVPMLYGHGWDELHDSQALDVVVLSKRLNERLFAGRNSIGETVDLNGSSYHVIGVTDYWDPKPRFYDVIGGQKFEEGEDAFMPLTRSIADQMGTSGYEYCDAGPSGKTFEDLLHSECVWIQFWVELPTPADVVSYRNVLINYSRDQGKSGRFAWEPNVRLRNVREWLIAQKVVPNDAKLSVLVAAGFFLVCLISSSGLMLAKDFARAGEFGVRRALGASAQHIFIQKIVESGVAGFIGGTCGLLLTLSALWALRELFPEGMGRIAHLDGPLFAMTFMLSVVASIAAGVYPAWHSTQVNPALQIKGG